MPKELKVGCARPTGGPVGKPVSEEKTEQPAVRKEVRNMVQVGKVGTIFGIYDEDAGVETRGRFIIDPDGVIQGYEVLTPPVGRNVNESLRQVQAFQLVRESKGTEATPSGWRPGKKTLKPGPELVGNVWKEWKTEMAFD